MVGFKLFRKFNFPILLGENFNVENFSSIHSVAFKRKTYTETFQLKYSNFIRSDFGF